MSRAGQLVDLEILFLLKQDSSTLYSLRKGLAQVFAEYRSYGTIHPHLVKLEERGLIKRLERGSCVGNGSGLYKRPLVLTRRGRNTLENRVNMLAETVLKMSSVAQRKHSIPNM